MENDGIQEGLAVGKIKHRRNKKKTLFFVVVIIAVLAGGAGFYYMTYVDNEPVAVCTGSPTSIVTKDISISLTPLGVNELRPIKDQIVEREQYDEDVNCMYILTMYYINTGDPVNARPTFTKFSELYAENSELSPLLGDSLYSLTDLNGQIEFLEKQREKFDSGATEADEAGKEALKREAGIE